MSPDARQVGGSHYKAVDPKQEHWNLVVAHGWDYFQARAIAYIMRCRAKNGKQDIEKAIHFLEKYKDVYDLLYPPPELRVGNAQNEHDEQHVQSDALAERFSDEHWLCEGYYGSGDELYRCRHCGEHVRAFGLRSAYERHGACTLPAGYVDQDR